MNRDRAVGARRVLLLYLECLQVARNGLGTGRVGRRQQKAKDALQASTGFFSSQRVRRFRLSLAGGPRRRCAASAML